MNATSSAPPVPEPRRAWRALTDGQEARASTDQLLCGLGLLFWLAMFGWLWLGAPTLGRVLGLLWFVLGALWPMGYFYSLALALPWFGNNPGGPHHLYLVEMGLMGLVSGHLTTRLLLWVSPKRSRLDAAVWFFVLYSCVCVFPQWRYLWAELLTYPRQFLFVIHNHYGTSYTFGLQLALKLALSAGLYVALRDRRLPALRLLRLWWLLVVSLAASALLGVGEYFDWLSLAWWRAENPDISRFGYDRLQSLYWHSGWYAQYLAALAPGALALAVIGRVARHPERAALLSRRPFRLAAIRVRWFYWSLVLLLCLTQLMTQQRGGWIALTAGLAVVIAAVMITNGPERLRWGRTALAVGLTVTTIVLLAGSVALFSPVFRHRVTELFAYEDRMDIWLSAIGLFRIHPLVGVGLGNYHRVHLGVYPEGHPYFHIDKVAPHSLYLHVLSERGLIGLIALLLIIAGVVWGAWRIVKESRDDLARWGTGLALLGGVVAILFYGIFQETFYIRTVDLIFWMFVALASWSPALALEPAAGAPPRWKRAVWIGLLILAAGGVVWGHRFQLQPVVFYLDGETFLTAGQYAKIDVPRDARRVAIRIVGYDPAIPQSPVTITFRAAGEELAREVLDTRRAREIELTLPPDRRPGEPIVAEVSRTWNPLLYDMRWFPLPRVGVLYQPPRVLETE
ncbi:MAG: O-Antigen ligase [candidate division BRC1 bacterium ADurb.BinA292]|nr:MAG: O-Antigen ligase [candidate division BRC1 bacterium ADurb.BinA292]